MKLVTRYQRIENMFNKVNVKNKIFFLFHLINQKQSFSQCSIWTKTEKQIRQGRGGGGEGIECI